MRSLFGSHSGAFELVDLGRAQRERERRKIISHLWGKVRKTCVVVSTFTISELWQGGAMEAAEGRCAREGGKKVLRRGELRIKRCGEHLLGGLHADNHKAAVAHHL